MLTFILVFCFVDENFETGQYGQNGVHLALGHILSRFDLIDQCAQHLNHFWRQTVNVECVARFALSVDKFECFDAIELNLFRGKHTRAMVR